MADIQCILDALTSPIRREILWRIWDRELPAGVIAEAFEVGPSTISEHLAVLRSAELVSMRAEGTFRLYQARQDVLRGVQPLLLASETRWTPTPGLDEVPRVSVSMGLAVTVAVDLTCTREEAFGSFVDGPRFSRWLGVPVTLSEGRFACTLEWGTEVRGTYDVVVSPALIVMRWDFADGLVPVPGHQVIAYAHFHETPGGCRVEVAQVVARQDEAVFMEAAWTFVLGRLQAGVGLE